MPSRPILLTALAAAALLAGCESLQRTDSFLGVITPYRIDIVQGNAVTREQVALLKPGMTRLQVRDILGTPLLTDPFHAHRWDYVFVLRRPNTDVQRRGVVVFFEGDRMASFEATELPSEREFVASISRFENVPERKLELTEEERKALPLPETREAAPAEPLGAVRDYPPLEAS
ncbi:MAG TPA: outer membrane protein assembly factor BamE [Rubrivivax sp.]|nr:outer membrane protein assembly factor BamE [Rubrivivax sp.]